MVISVRYEQDARFDKLIERAIGSGEVSIGSSGVIWN